MIGETMNRSWLGSIEGISLDWHSGVFIESLASPHSDPRMPSSVYYEAKCCLCEWAYGASVRRTTQQPVLSSEGLDVSYGYGTPDIEDVMRWVAEHRESSTAHNKAFEAFWKEKSDKKAAAAAENTGDK